MTTGIEWAEAVWNPVVGCSIVSPGCTNCYAMRAGWRLGRNPNTRAKYEGLVEKVNGRAVWTGAVRFDERVLTEPLRRRKPTRYFVNSMGDLFHESVTDHEIDRVFAVMALCPQHTFIVLTKRAERMRTYCGLHEGKAQIDFEIGRLAFDKHVTWPRVEKAVNLLEDQWPLPQVWLGVSVEDQPRAFDRMPDLVSTPAAVRLVSYEPALSEVSFVPWIRRLDWIIAGGESGPVARPMDEQWLRNLSFLCEISGVPLFIKQLGAVHAREHGFKHKKGGDPAEWPADLRVRQFPAGATP